MLCQCKSSSLTHSVLIFLLISSSMASHTFSNEYQYQPQPQEILLEESAETTSAMGVIGGGARLSCAVGTATGVQLAIWYKEGHEQAVYTWDSRGRAPEHARHWAANLLGGRAHFSPPAALVLTNLRTEDNGVYRCRIDFHKSPTRNTRVNLTVIVPPSRVEIQDDQKRPIQGKTRAYREGEPVKLYCIPHGGDPPTTVSWWRGGALLSKSSFLEILADRGSLNEPLTCQATNNNISVPLSVAIHLDLILRPLSIRIQGPKRSFSANKSTEVKCLTFGARPKPSISWWKGTTRLKSTRESTSNDGNLTTSILSFTPQLDDAGKYLSCKAIQTSLQEPGLEDGWKLEIHHIPIVNLYLGSSLNAAGIIEGTDVYFECNIKANPWVYKIQWYHEGELLQSNPQEGVIISNQSLVLQSLKKSRSGIYTCIATNEEGEGRSNKLLLDVKFRPYCRKGQQVVYNIARNEEAKISCELLANPQDNVRFSWKFNNSELLSTVLPTSKVITYNTGNNVLTRNEAFAHATSIASYTPRNSSDYGTLMCIGSNSVGTQYVPCVFHIVPAGKPDPLTNCTVNNQTTDILQINCIEGFDGGLPQKFIVQVYNTQNNFLMKNSTFETPQFDFTNLPSAAYFNIDIYAYNKKGISDVFTLQTHTLKEPEKRTGSVTMALQLTPLLGALLGFTALLVLLAIALVFLARCRNHRRIPQNGQNTTKPYGEHQDGSSMPLNATDTESVDSLDKSPDILLDGKIADKTSSKLAKYKAANTPLTNEDIDKKPAQIPRVYIPPETNNEMFNGQYVQIDPLRYGVQPMQYSGQNAPFRLQNGRPVYLQQKADDPDNPEITNRNVYDRVYEDMLKYRNSPGLQNQMMPEDATLGCPELYINCHSPVQAVYNNPSNYTSTSSQPSSIVGVPQTSTPMSNMGVSWYPGTNQGHLVNYVVGSSTLGSRTGTPLPPVTSRDKDYLIMTPSQKATIIPKNFTQSANPYQGFNHRINNHSFDGTTYTTVPTMSTHRSHVISPTSMPNTLPTKYDKTSPEESMRSLHIRLDQPSDFKPLNRLNKTKESPTAMCEMVTDFTSSKSALNENKVIETNH